MEYRAWERGGGGGKVGKRPTTNAFRFLVSSQLGKCTSIFNGIEERDFCISALTVDSNMVYIIILYISSSSIRLLELTTCVELY